MLNRPSLEPLHICLLHPSNDIYHANDQATFNEHHRRKHHVATKFPPRECGICMMALVERVHRLLIIVHACKVSDTIGIVDKCCLD